MKQLNLKFLWLEKSIAVALDQRISDRSTPLTEFFFWPQTDAWEEVKSFLEKSTWVDQNDSVVLLNQLTEVINEWQEKSDAAKVDFVTLRNKFPNSIFIGFD